MDLEAYGELEWSLWSELSAVSGHWQSIFAEYWGLDASTAPAHLTFEQWERAKNSARTAPRLVTMALALNLRAIGDGSVTEPLAPDSLRLIREYLSDNAATPLIRDAVSFEVADDAISRGRHSGERLAKLLSLVLDHQLTGRAATYLSRATRLYLFGFEPECLVMCRAALDAALQEVVDYSNSAGVRATRSDLAGRIDAACRLNLFTPEMQARAHTLRKAGNEAVHLLPAFTVEGIGDAMQSIAILSELLAALFPNG
jgi:Domain of unknown function (DUF4145)